MIFKNQDKCVLVTGGAGFIGSHTAEALMKKYNCKKVVIVDEVNDYYNVALKQRNLEIVRQCARETGSDLSIYKLDICDRNGMEDIFQKEHITHVVHLAARAGVRASIEQPELYVHSNVLGTTILLDLASKYRSQIQHFVYASSSSVYGANDKVPFSETDLINRQVSPYAASKVACEAMAAAYANMNKMNITGLRFFTVYGPRGRPDMAPFKFVDRVMRGQSIDQYGDGSSSRDYTYIDDIVDGIVKSLFFRELINSGNVEQEEFQEYHQIFNLGNSSPVSLIEFISTIELATGRKAIRKLLPMQKGDVEKTFADVSKAHRAFGYQPTTSLAEGLAKLTSWWLEQYGNEIGLSSSSHREEEENSDHEELITYDLQGYVSDCTGKESVSSSAASSKISLIPDSTKLLNGGSLLTSLW